MEGYSTPPNGTHLFTGDNFSRNAGGWRPDREVLDCEDSLDRLGPGVESEVEESPVDGHEQAVAAHCAKGAHSSMRAHVDFAPEGVRCADFKHCEIEGAKLPSDLRKAVPFSRVGTVVDTVRRSAESEGCPQSLKPVEETAAGEMAGGQGRDGYGANSDVAGPVERRAAGSGHAEALENAVDAERCDKAGCFKLGHRCQGANCVCAKMIVVVMGDDDGVDGRQVCEGKRRGKKTSGASPLRGGGALLPDGIDEYANSIDLNQRGGVAEPCNSEAGAGAGGEDSGIRVEWAWRSLGRPGCRIKEEAGTDFEHYRESAHLGRYRVQELLP